MPRTIPAVAMELVRELGATGNGAGAIPAHRLPGSCTWADCGEIGGPRQDAWISQKAEIRRQKSENRTNGDICRIAGAHCKTPAVCNFQGQCEYEKGATLAIAEIREKT